MISGHFLGTLSNPLDKEPVMNGYLKRHEETISPGSITVHFGYSYCREEGASIIRLFQTQTCFPRKILLKDC